MARCLLWACALLLGPLNAHAQGTTTVAAASDLQFALEELGQQFRRDTGHRIRFVFGSSGQFATQILQGAPYDLFMSADESLVFKLEAAGKTRDKGKIYALGRIGLMVPHGSPVRADGELRGVAAALQEGRIRQFAVANPHHAPYGMRAREALEHAGLWTALEPRLVMGENVSQATQFTLSGSVQAGIIALSLAQRPAVAQGGQFVLIPADWHQPLRQRMVLLKGAPPAARQLYDYLGSPAAQTVLRRHGFDMPGERD